MLSRKSAFIGFCFTVAASACGGEAHVEADSDSPLTLYSASATGGLNGYYTDESGETLYFETARLPREHGIEGSERDFDLAVRFIDGNDRTLLLLTEGHNLPEGWATDAETDSNQRAINENVYELARLTADAIDSYDFDATVDDDKALLTAQLRAFADDPGRKLEPGEISNMKLNEQVARLSASPARSAVTYSIQIIDSYWKPAFIQSANAHHTATMTYRFANIGGQWVFQTSFVRCNHGSCPGDYSMSYYTRHWGSVTPYYPVTPQICSSAYGMPHVCNNDTMLQQDNVVYNSTYNTWSGVCGYTEFYRPY